MTKILFLNHKEKQCGVYQYGYRLRNILSQSEKYTVIYCEITSETELDDLIRAHQPSGMIFNYHEATMPWLRANHTSNIVSYCLHHEGKEPEHLGFRYFIMVDSTYTDTERCFSIGRPLFNNHNVVKQNPPTLTIGSFGFGAMHKGFRKIVQLVNNQFDNAIIRFHIPRARYGDWTGETTNRILSECHSDITKSGIKLVSTHNFLSDDEILSFLSSNSLNMFLYDDMNGCGLSSVIDYALSVDVPFAIRKSHMFRHIYDTASIRVEDRTLSEIMNNGVEAILQYRSKWSPSNLVSKLEHILEKTI
jgi:hypothetical protein